eukprot:43274-Eustigmatos_ZCMA.PRE.1
MQPYLPCLPRSPVRWVIYLVRILFAWLCRMKQEFARRGSEYLAALSAIVSLRRSSTAGPTALDSVLNRLGFGTAEKVKAAMEAEAAGKD